MKEASFFLSFFFLNLIRGGQILGRGASSGSQQLNPTSANWIFFPSLVIKKCAIRRQKCHHPQVPSEPFNIYIGSVLHNASFDDVGQSHINELL